MERADAPELRDRVILITGAGSGIGRALCAGFAAEGAAVVGFGRRIEALAETAALAGGMTMFPGDVNSPRDTAALIEAVMARFGRIDVLINNAGQLSVERFAESDFERWMEVVETNLFGVARLIHRVLPLMLARRFGRIVNLVSRAPEACHPGTSAYAVSKGGVLLLTRVLAQEIDAGRYPDVLINDLIPGPTRTGMNPHGQPPEQVYPFVRDLVQTPRGGPTGMVFFQGRPYTPWAHHGAGETRPANPDPPAGSEEKRQDEH